VTLSNKQPDQDADGEPKQRRGENDDDERGIDAIDGAFVLDGISAAGIIRHQMILPRTIGQINHVFRESSNKFPICGAASLSSWHSAVDR